MKVTQIIKSFIDNSISIGDKVKIVDGSSITLLIQHAGDELEEIEIEYSYKQYTGSNLKIKDMIGTVIQTGISTNVVECTGRIVYLQDVIVQFGTGLFRTSSALLSK